MIGDERGQLPLHLACACEDPNVDAIGALVSAKPEALQQADALQRLPIHRAAASPRPSARAVVAVRLLLRADVDLQYHILDTAAAKRQMEVEKFKEEKKLRREEEAKRRGFR